MQRVLHTPLLFPAAEAAGFFCQGPSEIEAKLRLELAPLMTLDWIKPKTVSLLMSRFGLVRNRIQIQTKKHLIHQLDIFASPRSFKLVEERWSEGPGLARALQLTDSKTQSQIPKRTSLTIVGDSVEA